MLDSRMAYKYGGIIIIVMVIVNILFYSRVKLLVGKVWISFLYFCGIYMNEKNIFDNFEFYLLVNFLLFLWDIMYFRSVFEVMLMGD